MLIGLKEELKPGGVVDIDLSFDDGSRTRIQAPVRAIAPMGAKH
jgi:copper(I)-binding protein